MNQDKLKLSKNQFKRWGGKRYIVLIKVRDVEQVTPFKIDRSNFGNMNDWLFIQDINRVIAS